MHITKFLSSRMPKDDPCSNTSFAVTDHLRYGRVTVVKLCDIGNRQCLHLNS